MVLISNTNIIVDEFSFRNNNPLENYIYFLTHMHTGSFISINHIFTFILENLIFTYNYKIIFKDLVLFEILDQFIVQKLLRFYYLTNFQILNASYYKFYYQSTDKIFDFKLINIV